MTHLVDDSLKQFLRRLRFTESLEMLSINACVLNDPKLMMCDVEKMTRRKGEICKARRDMCDHAGYEMCPALLVSSVLGEV